MVGALFAAIIVLGPSPDFQDKRPPARVYVFTAQAHAGAVSEEEQGRLDSLRDVLDLMADRKSDFTLVNTAEQAEVVVELVNREELETPQGGFGGASMTRFRQTIVRLHVTAGEKQSDLKGVGQPSWKAAAKDAVERLRKWVRNLKPAGAGTEKRPVFPPAVSDVGQLSDCPR